MKAKWWSLILALVLAGCGEKGAAGNGAVLTQIDPVGIVTEGDVTIDVIDDSKDFKIVFPGSNQDAWTFQCPSGEITFDDIGALPAKAAKPLLMILKNVLMTDIGYDSTEDFKALCGMLK